MSTLVVARKDFKDAIRSKLLWALTALFALFAAAIGFAYSQLSGDGPMTGGPGVGAGLAGFVGQNLTLFISVAAIVVCHRSIAGERESGSLKLLLSLPHSRGDVVVGKLLGRTAVLAVPVIGTFFLGIAVGGALTGTFDVVATLGVAVVTLLFVLTYAGVFVGVSAFTGSTTLATAIAVGYFVIFEVIWDLVGFIVLFVANGFSFDEGIIAVTQEWWYYVYSKVPPSKAYVAAMDALVPGVSTDSLGGGGFISQTAAANADSVFVTPWVGVAFLLFWLVVPMALGYGWFRRADL